MSSLESSQAQLAEKAVAEGLRSAALVLPVVGYLTWLLLGLAARDAGVAAAFAVPAFVAFFVVTPFLAIRRMLEGGGGGGGAPEGADARLLGLLELPRRVEVTLGLHALLGVGTVAAACAWRFERGWMPALVAVAFMVAANAATGAGLRGRLEELIAPQAAEAFRARPGVRPSGHGLRWPRQSWSVPLVAAGSWACTVIAAAVLVAVHVPPDLAGRLVLPGLVLAGLLLAGALTAARSHARREGRASRSLVAALDALAAGAPPPPLWISTDEPGDVAFALAAALEKQTLHGAGLRESARRLVQFADQLSQSSRDQHRNLGRQAAAIHETQVTAQEIRQTSELAFERTKVLLKLVERAEEVGRLGEATIEKTLEGLQEIRQQVDEMAGQIRDLGERARQVASITSTVKDLADQSNMLALNAAIEAVRSGVHGKGFGVVAREIRSLADQSLQATHQVRERLDDIGEAIGRAVALTERGGSRLEASFHHVRASGDSLRELSGIVRENASSVRQIAGAVSQQNAGIAQVFDAIRELGSMMDETLQLVERTREAGEVVRLVAASVDSVVRLQRAEPASMPPPGHAPDPSNFPPEFSDPPPLPRGPRP